MRPFQRDKRHPAKPSGNGGGAKEHVVPPPAAPPAASAPAVPELKKKEEEKKRGAAWMGGSSAPGIAVRGAEVGAAASRAGLLGSRAISAALSNMFGGSATAVGTFFAGKYGANLVLGALLAWAGLIGVAALSLFGKAPSPAAARRGMDLSMDGGGPLIDRPRDRSLGMVANANQGELTWEEQQKRDAAKAAEEQAADAPKEPEAPKLPDVSDVLSNMNQAAGAGLPGDFAKGLSKGFGSGGSGGMLAMGGKPGLDSGAGGFNLKSSFGGKAPARALDRGKMSRFARARQALSAKKMSTLKGQSSRAMGQLKLARTMSNAAEASAPDAQARQYSANAFDQTASKGGEMAGIDPSGAVVPAGTGAPGIDNSVPDAPTVPTGENVTPYQPNLDAAKNMGDMAGMLKMLSMMLLGIGAALVALGAYVMSLTFPGAGLVGALIMAAGLALIMMGMMMMNAAKGMANAAKGQGDQIENQYGQKDQGQVVDECADNSANTGQSVGNCKPATTTPQSGSNGQLQQDISTERNSTYQLEGSGGEQVTTHSTQPK